MPGNNKEMSENELRQYIHKRALNILNNTNISNALNNNQGEIIDPSSTEGKVANWALARSADARLKRIKNIKNLKNLAKRINSVASQTNSNRMLFEINKNI